MSFARQKRLLLGMLALIAPIPLPFNEVVAWPAVAAYLIGTLLFLRRTWLDVEGRQRWLPNWALNVLGLIYLPLGALDLFVISRRLLTPVLHLILFALLVKLFSLTRERDKWQAAIGIFFLFLASMGTSVHPTIVLYLVAFLVLSLILLTRFAFLHVLAGFGREDPELARIPMKGFLLLCTVMTFVLAVPLFAFLPRVPSPYIVGRGSGLGQTIESAGFSDEVTLDSIGQIRNSRDVALRLLEEGTLDPNRDMRFKAATYDLYQGGTWRRSPMRMMLQRGTASGFWLTRGRQPERWARIFLAPINSRSVPVPVETVVIEPRATSLALDEGGAVSFGFNPLELVEYRVGLVDAPVLTGEEPSGNPYDPALDLAGVTPRIAALAARVMGSGTSLDRAQRLEAHLIQDYEYTLDFSGRSRDNPIEDFLFRYKSGQCEYFASSMVLMLRSQGIPARLVTGFLGGEYNPFEGYYIVRDSNAHAWVEAYLEGEGWRIFDPTPPAGRPIGEEMGLPLLMRQAWDFVAFRWDRYVLTFGLYDQLRIFGGLRDLWNDLWSRLRQEDKPQKAPAGSGQQVIEEEVAAGNPGSRLPDIPLPWALGLTLLAAAVFAIYLRLKPPLTATAAYTRLRRRLGRRGPPLPESVPPLVVGQEMAARYPAAAEPVAKVIAFYLRESFGGHPLEDEEREVLEAALDEAEKGMRKAG
ncbi:MAG TPA: transglutaminaseTgpA domain-containing protein [Thermoanaerobaculia bacterium]|nr:transglutaminaseTgpA domain-containing protein [Thermoanaerobaculia bacterium]